jgi:chromosome segregation ATPase
MTHNEAKKISREASVALDSAMKEESNLERKIKANEILLRGLSKNLKELKNQSSLYAKNMLQAQKQTSHLETESSLVKKSSRKEQLEKIKELNLRERDLKDKMENLERQLALVQKEKRQINIGYLQAFSQGKKFRKEAFKTQESISDLKKEQKELKEKIQTLTNESQRVKIENEKFVLELKRIQADIKKKKHAYHESFKRENQTS